MVVRGSFSGLGFVISRDLLPMPCQPRGRWFESSLLLEFPNFSCQRHSSYQMLKGTGSH